MAKTKFDKYELYMGLNDADKKVQIWSTADAQRVVQNQVAQWFNGGTVFTANGVYKHDDGTVVIENTIKIEIIIFDKTVTEKTIREFVDYLKKEFNQESIAVQHSRIYSDLW